LSDAPAGVAMTLDSLRDLARAKLRAAGLAGDHADAVAETMVSGERDGCASHGIYRLLVADRSIRAGVVVPDAVPQVSEPKAGLVRVDGGGGFAQLAFERGMPLLVEKARANGIAALALNHVVHFAALWPEVEMLAEQGLVALPSPPATPGWRRRAGPSRCSGPIRSRSAGPGRDAIRSCSTSPPARWRAARSNCTAARAGRSPRTGAMTPRDAGPPMPRRY
jgi:hypothetical protein